MTSRHVRHARACLCVLAAVVAVTVVVQWYDTLVLHHATIGWTGFGPERGVYNFTVVTGLLDVGRGGWWRQSRSYERYLTHLFQVLKLDVNLIIYIEPKGANFVRRIRKGRELRTAVVETSLDDLPCYKDLPRVRRIMTSPEFRQSNANWAQGKAESLDPLYVVVTNSKAALLQRAVTSNPVTSDSVTSDPFASDFYVWLDAGLGHGDPTFFPEDGVLFPRKLLEVKDKVTFVSLTDLDLWRDVSGLHKVDTALMAGGVLGGGRGALLRFCRRYQESWRAMLTAGVADDDQTTFMWTYVTHPALFRPVPGAFSTLLDMWA